LLRQNLRRMCEIACRGLAACAVSAFTRVCEAQWARRDFARAVNRVVRRYTPYKTLMTQ
jgi:hypothetical protein